MGSLEDNKNGLFTVDLTHNNKQERAVGLRKVAVGRWALASSFLYMPSLLKPSLPTKLKLRAAFFTPEPEIFNSRTQQWNPRPETFLAS